MFQGFTDETVDFMWGIRFNNERGWFMEHKGDYQRYFHEPMKALGAEVQEKLLERFPECGLNVKLSRIYRDARRLFGFVGFASSEGGGDHAGGTDAEQIGNGGEQRALFKQG